MLNVSQKKLLALMAPIPPVSLQTKFAAAVWRTYEMEDRIENAVTQSDVLFNSIVQRAFRGKL